MQPKTYLMAGLVLLLAACGGKKSDDTKDIKDTLKSDQTTVFRTQFDTQKFLGEYMGVFGKNTLILDINYVNGTNVSGYDIVKGNRRNIKGTLEDKGDRFSFKLEEPGSDKYDGVFEFTIDTANLQVDGKWSPLDPKQVDPKTYSLKKRSSQGQPEGYAGTWFLEGFTVELKTDGTGIAKGGYEDAKGEWKETEIRCTWMDNGNDGINVEWAKNSVFKVAVMKFRMIKTEYDEEYLDAGTYAMYRYW